MKEFIKKIKIIENELNSIKSEINKKLDESENNVVLTTRQIRILLACLIEYHRYRNIRLDNEEENIEKLLNKYLS